MKIITQSTNVIPLVRIQDTSACSLITTLWSAAACQRETRQFREIAHERDVLYMTIKVTLQHTAKFLIEG